MKKDKCCKHDKEGMIIGGCTMLGLGVGFFLLQYSALYFVGALMCGIGLGLLIAYKFRK